MPTVHQPVMLKEVLEFLAPQKNQNFIDGTVGAGGHAAAILEKTSPEGKLLGLDWDKEAIARTTEKLSKFSHRTILVNASYRQMKEIAKQNDFQPIDGILLDLGLSSDQLQSSGRGFSFQRNEPLDMRYSLDNEVTATEILNKWSKQELINIFRDFGEERQAVRIASAIVAERKLTPITTTLQLVELINKNKHQDPRKKTNPATQVFQALRIAVNRELENVKEVLGDCLEMLEPHGRLAIISFHSLEDRIVKDYFKQESKDCLCPPEIPVCRCGHLARLKLITKKPLTPSEQEVNENFRARSAKLRVIEKL